MTYNKDATQFSTEDMYFFNQGTHYKLYNKLGAHLVEINGTPGTLFRVWAPNAKYVSVIGEFNGWNRGSNSMYALGHSGVWETFIPHTPAGCIYKYFISSHANNYEVEKMDPFGFHHEVPPKSASVTTSLEYKWNDKNWMSKRQNYNSLHSPISIYEIHLGSWFHKFEQGSPSSLSYKELAQKLATYVAETGFTHVEFLPIMEHPFYGSWGYQTTGYYAPSSRYGTPQDFMTLVDTLHQNNIGVILDWVPSHFATDEYGLGFFDGTHLFEHADQRQGFHPDWGSFIFNYNRHEVRSFLISNALFWLDKYHIDGIRVDAVASMLYLDYSRKEGEWIPNEFGGRDNLPAIHFIKQLNEAIYAHFPDVQTIAEESTAWTGVSRPTYLNGLGFGLKWDMGWMHDTLEYMKKDPIYRKYHQNDLTFRYIYAFTENFTLPLSHDEVVHGKGSLLRKMPGDEWQQFANLRALFTYMFTAPGKKLLFMGLEFGQWDEWNYNQSLDWHLMDFDRHQQIHRLVADLNQLYKSHPALHQQDCQPEGFRWIDASNHDQSILIFSRHGRDNHPPIVIVLNFTPTPHYNYQIGVPQGGTWLEILNSDAQCYGGGGIGNFGKVQSSSEGFHGQSHSISITIPPLSGVIFKPAED